MTPRAAPEPIVERPIIGFHRDAEGDWVAELSCGHAQHVRHRPPFTERPWVTDAAGRAGRIGTPLACPPCARREIPAGHAPYRRTATFEQDDLPAALRRRHTTKAGVWARIHVLRGRLEYRIHEPFRTREVLDPRSPGTVLPEVEHQVSPLGEVAFFVEFWRADGGTLGAP